MYLRACRYPRVQPDMISTESPAQPSVVDVYRNPRVGSDLLGGPSADPGHGRRKTWTTSYWRTFDRNRATVCPYRWDARRRTLRSEVPRIREYAGVTYFAGQTPFFFRRSSSYPTYPTLTNVAFPVLVRRDLHTAEYRLALWETGRSNALFLSLAFRFYFFCGFSLWAFVART